MLNPLTIAVQPAGTATVGFWSAVKDATRTSPAARPAGAANATVETAVDEFAVDELRAVIPEAGGAGLTVIVAVADVEPPLLVAVSLTV